MNYNILRINNKSRFKNVYNKSFYLIFTIYDILKINTSICINFLFFHCSFNNNTQKNNNAKLDFAQFNISNNKIEHDDYWGWFIDTDNN